MLSHSGSEAGPPEEGGRGRDPRVWGVGRAGGKERTSGSQEESARQPRLQSPRPGCTWHEVSLEIILVAPPVLWVRCGSDVSWGESSLHPSPWRPTPPLPQGLLPQPPRPYLPLPVRPRVPAPEGRSDELQPPSPRGLGVTPSQCPAGPLSASPPFCGTLTPPRTSSLPLLPTGSPSSPVTVAMGD